MEGWKLEGWKLEGWKVQEVLSYPLFPDTSTKPSAAGARRGVSNCIQTNCIQTNCIQTTILLGPPAEGRPGPSGDNGDDGDDGDDEVGEDITKWFLLFTNLCRLQELAALSI